MFIGAPGGISPNDMGITCAELVTRHCMISFDDLMQTYCISPLDGLVFYRVDGVTRLRYKQLVAVEDTMISIKVNGEELAVKIFNGSQKGIVYEYEPSHRLVTVGNGEDSTIKLDFLKSEVQFRIEYGNRWEIGVSTGEIWLQICKTTPISSDLTYKLGTGYLKAHILKNSLM